MIDLGAYLIEADDRSVTLRRKHVTEKGESTTVVVGFYTSLHNVARKLATLKAHEAIAAGKSLTEVVDAINTATAVILEALEPVVTPPATVHPEQGTLPC